MCNTNNPNNNTQSHRDYWDSFIDQWKTCSSNSILCWTNPDCVPLYNDTNNLSSCFIPEPWWGNDGNDFLHSVVINYNPGAGGLRQKKDHLPFFNTYSEDIVKNNKLYLIETIHWHWVKRARPIYEALNFTGTSLNNHLSIELIPWHTASANDNNLKEYLRQNIVQVYKHCILFAAEESRRINNPYLRDVVIIRMNGDKTRMLLKLLNRNVNVSICIQNVVGDKDGKIQKFKITDNNNPIINDVTFVSIWGEKTRNNFPNNLASLLSNFHNSKTVICDTTFSAKKKFIKHPVME